MKKRMIIAKYLGVFSLLILISSCEAYYEEVVVEKKDYGFYEFYNDENQFLYSRNIFYGYDERYENAYSGMHKYLEKGRTLFIDARTTDGRSTWSSPKFVVKTTSDVSEINILIATLFSGANDHKHEMRATSVSLLSPPAHLHLCLNTWNEAPFNKLPGKTWIAQSVEDVNGKSLADDYDWGPYTDNLIRFEKTTNFILAPGSKRSQIELDLFGSEAKQKTVYGNYSVKEDASKKVMLTLSFPKFTQELEVISSSWTSLTLKGTYNGKTGIIKLVPDPDPQHDKHSIY